ncbi:MAG: di-trans,poly-cis-decaprenylcistransferase [Oscillospiraceae bacterium]|nr:di-trans,poly-cis-decaprenylcistransferase [Oscillospiraceae bacterium]
MTQDENFAKGLSIGIIMDGNGRWAKQRNLPRTAGHKRGAEVFEDIGDYCSELGVSSVYFYAFSTENWSRPAEEVSGIMKLFGEYLVRAYDFKKRNNRIVFIGEREGLRPEHQRQMRQIEEDTKDRTGMILNIAINYGARSEILHGVKALSREVQSGALQIEDITEEHFSKALYTSGQRDPDFILRPSGEKRLSNFLLWQSAYAEFVEMDVLWPDFTRAHLDEAIREFNKRTRRFGGI